MYYKKTGLNRGKAGGKVELAVPDVELKAALMMGGLIGTTGGIASFTDSERDISHQRPSCKTNSMTHQYTISPSQTGVPRIKDTDSIPNDSVYRLSILTA